MDKPDLTVYEHARLFGHKEALKFMEMFMEAMVVNPGDDPEYTAVALGTLTLLKEEWRKRVEAYEATLKPIK